MAVDYLIIGHVTQDITPRGPQLGGTALYAAATAQRLGWQVGLVTRAPATLDIEGALPGLQLHRLETDQATTFENHYLGNDRRQIVHHAAPPLTLADIPVAWRRAPILHLAPVAREVDPSLAAAFPHSLVGATPQGWLRDWDESGKVRYAPLA
nr:carbohydrate kinase [Ardenticatenales bacterium]